MAVKEIPTNIKQYYHLMRERTYKKLDDDIELKDCLENKAKVLYNDIKNNLDVYKDKFNINLLNYDEFVLNKYSTGELYKDAKGLFLNRKDNYKMVSELYDLYGYANKLKDIYDLEKDILRCQKLLDIKFKEYTEILRTYYTEVHKQMILNGYGYSFGERIGWICINRVLASNKVKVLDFAATKKREAELKAQGKRIYNKEEAQWCAKHGIEYKAEDKRVFKNDEYFYEIPLIGCRLEGGSKLKLEVSDYRQRSVRGMTNDDLITKCNEDTNKICELPIDLKTKLTLCDKVDKILYTKFIRNETQKSIAFRKINS